MQGFGADLDNYADPGLDLERYVHGRTADWLDHWQVRDDHSPQGVQRHRDRVRAAVLAGLGGLPERSGTLDVEVTGQQADPAGRQVVENLSFASVPGVRVTANLYRPDQVTTRDPGPAVVFACGHTYEAKAAERYRLVCRSLAAAGMTVLAVDPYGQGERVLAPDHDPGAGRGWGVDEHLRTGTSAWWLGTSLMRWMVADLMAGVDLLAALPEVDADRIGITGNSGGGTQVSIMLAVEPRLAAAAPGTYITGRREYQRMGQLQDPEQHLLGGTVAGVDHADLLISFAPKPLQVLAVAWDFFPIEGTRAAVERATDAYRALGSADRLSLTVDDSVHTYSPGLEAAAVRFFCDAFGLPVPDDPVTGPGGPTAEQLRVTRTGQLATDDPDAVMITDLIAAELDRGEVTEDPSAWLAERVYRHRRRPVADAVRWIGTRDEPHLFWNSEQDLWGAAVLLDPEAPGRPRRGRPGGPAIEPTPLTLVLLPDGTGTADSDTLLPPPGDGPRLVVDLRGQGALASRQRGSQPRTSLRGYDFKLLCDLLWLDDSLAAGRVFDLVRAVDVLTADRTLRGRWPGIGPRSKVEVATVGGLARWHAELAAVVDPRIAAVRHDDAQLDLDRAIRTANWDEQVGDWQALIPGIATWIDRGRPGREGGRRSPQRG